MLIALNILFFFRELSVAGNRLECEGMTELLRPVVALCEASDPSQQILPPLAKLFLQDNAIDIHGTCGGVFAPVISMRALKRLESGFLLYNSYSVWFCYRSMHGCVWPTYQ